MTKLYAEPEWLGRRDAEHGAWQVEECEARRGIPATSIVSRQMRVPTHDTEQSRCIRAHEMMHAKISPANEWEKWLGRKIASQESLVAVEELRVNHLCKIAGFKVDEHLSDGGETADGERVASTEDWGGAVRMAIATAGTSSNKAFLNGVRRHNRLWGKVLLDISKRAVKEMKKIHPSALASTDVHAPTGLAPAGFFHTERLAEWIDRLVGSTPPSEETEDSDSSSTDGGIEDNDGGTTTIAHTNEGIGKPRPATEGDLKKITPISPRAVTPYWGNLVVEKMPMPTITRGNLGKKRIASNVGRSPRRIHRLATDPEKRIFDKTARGMGGVVIIDGSGSMSLSHDEVRQIVEASPGCTVAVYSDMDNNNGGTNFWILADKGRMTDEMPTFGSGNGVDFPAIEWGVKHRQHSRSPVVWVTDGGVCGPHQGYSEVLAMQCINYCKKNRVVAVEQVSEAIGVLKALKSGRRARRTWNFMFKNTHHKMTGNHLADDEVR